ncbi:MAG: ADP-heptose:LPS heptosyltransferase [Parvicella sp.]|jgi:ADP-heptose:LPS heptosyltransferase
MRSNRRFSLREMASFVKQSGINWLSLKYFKLVSQKRVTLIRDGGLGDAIMSTAVISAFQEKYPETRIRLITSFPEVFDLLDIECSQTRSFPYFWLSYGFKDLPIVNKFGEKHIKFLMGGIVGLSDHEVHNYLIPFFSDVSFIESKGLRKNGYVIIQPEAGEWFRDKNWDNSSWIKLSTVLLKKGFVVCQIGTMSNKLIEGAVDFRGKCTLTESFTLVRYSRLVLCVNSFAEQVASAFNIPTIVLYGPTNPKYSLNQMQWSVYNDKIVSFENLKQDTYHFSKVTDIQVETVQEAIEIALGN